MTGTVEPRVVAVSRDGEHRFSKPTTDEITLLAGLGVQGDAHAGVTVQHLSRVAADPTQPNLRQVHLMHAELHDELGEQGFAVRPGQLGENITTRGLDLLALPRGTVLRLGPDAVVEITGLRNPCQQINGFRPGLLKQVLTQDPDGNVVRKAGIMGVVVRGGAVKPGDAIDVELPAEPHEPLERV
jgi:MOSC domain-containing protein YiiM